MTSAQHRALSGSRIVTSNDPRHAGTYVYNHHAPRVPDSTVGDFSMPDGCHWRQGDRMAYVHCSVCHLAMYPLVCSDGTVIRWCEACDVHLAYLLPA